MSKIEEILKEAKLKGASDVHITVGLPPKMRLNGKLIAMESYGKMMPNDTQEIAHEVTNDKQKQLLEENGQHDLSFAIMGVGRFRLNIFKQRGSIAMAFRVVATEIPTAESLGIPETVIDLYKKKRGLVLVTGPTGSGKSTTLASIIDMINNNREAHVITLAYANALRAALREDPDVILVGEMRDLETISTAITAAETGHLVLSTVHTIGSTNTVDRLIDVFPSHQQQQIRIQLASVLEAIISQQLLPAADDSSRLAAFEVLHVNSAVRNLIREGKSHQLITYMQTYRKQGMITMDEAIIELYRQQKITREVALQFAQDPETMQNKMLR